MVLSITQFWAQKMRYHETTGTTTYADFTPSTAWATRQFKLNSATPASSSTYSFEVAANTVPTTAAGACARVELTLDVCPTVFTAMLQFGSTTTSTSTTTRNKRTGGRKLA